VVRWRLSDRRLPHQSLRFALRVLSQTRQNFGNDLSLIRPISFLICVVRAVEVENKTAETVGHEGSPRWKVRTMSHVNRPHLPRVGRKKTLVLSECRNDRGRQGPNPPTGLQKLKGRRAARQRSLNGVPVPPTFGDSNHAGPAGRVRENDGRGLTNPRTPEQSTTRVHSRTQVSVQDPRREQITSRGW